MCSLVQGAPIISNTVKMSLCFLYASNIIDRTEHQSDIALACTRKQPITACIHTPHTRQADDPLTRPRVCVSCVSCHLSHTSWPRDPPPPTHTSLSPEWPTSQDSVNYSAKFNLLGGFGGSLGKLSYIK